MKMKEQRLSNDSSLCVPYLLGCHATEVSEITSPNFSTTTIQQTSSTLFSRISKGIVDALSPPAFDYSPSTINAADYFFEECNLDDCNDGHGKSSSPTYALHTQRVPPEPKVDPKSKSVSWVISPSMQSAKSSNFDMKARKTELVEHPSIVPSCSPRSAVTSKSLHPKTAENAVLGEQPSTLSSSSPREEWRGVVDPESGRTYYYNRRTRISKWRLPKDATLVKSRTEISVTTEQKTPLAPHLMLDEINAAILQPSSNEDQRRSSQRRRNEAHSLMQESSERSMTSLLTSGCEQGNAVEEKKPLPQDCTHFAVFCLYCGVQCKTIEILRLHLSVCDGFSYLARHGLSTQIELESTLFHAWSHISSDRLITALEEESQLRGLNLHTTEEDDVKVSKVATYRLRTEVDVNACIAEKKICPFCNEGFAYGNEFSSHLLRCSVRRRLRKQRRSLVSVERELSPTVTQKERVTPGRRMPWE